MATGHCGLSKKFFFDAPDPQMVVCLKSSGELELEFQIMDVSQRVAELLGKQLKFRDKKIDMLEKAAACNRKYENMENA